VNCEEARELIGADPDTVSPELQAHLADCHACEDYRKDMLALNEKMRRALEIDLRMFQRAPGTGVPVGSDFGSGVGETGVGVAPSNPGVAPSTPASVGSPATGERSNVTAFRRRAHAAVPRNTRPRGLAIAASLAAGVLVALTLWLSRPPESLAAEVVTHVEGEPNSWSKTQQIPSEELQAVLHKSGVKMTPGVQQIVYASSCYFRGHFVPHFVVTTTSGPVTIMILSNEHIDAKQGFNEAGYSGLLVPMRNGSIAVLSRTPMSLDQPAADMIRALETAQGITSTALPSFL
jgi:hypothetical protein